MEVIELFEEVGCEEFYGEDEDRRAWMEEMQQEYEAEFQQILLEAANFRLQEIAAEMAEARAEVEYDFLYFGA